MRHSKSKTKKKRVIGEYDNTATSSRVLSTFNGIKREAEEILMESEERDFIKLPDAAHGLKPIGRRWLGKAVIKGKRGKL